MARLLLATREEEAFGIAAGLYLGGRLPTVMLQSSGLGNSLNALTSLLMRRIRRDNTWPGPISTNVSTPLATISRTEPTHSTGATSRRFGCAQPSTG